MTKRQEQRVLCQLREAFKRDFMAFLKTMTPADMGNIVARAIGNRQVGAKQGARP